MDNQAIVNDFLQQYNKRNKCIKLPEFLKEYRIISCSYERKEKSCYLVANRNTDEKYLLKINQGENEREILKIEHERICQLAESFPTEYKESLYWKEEKNEYLLRHYISGMDLEKYQERNRILRVQEILRITIELCEIVEKLHSMTPPVLHRDIKPKNLIIDDRGRLHLIDFETARNYSENKTKDTIICGTLGIAAPEQYGYSQTDVRTDVYGIGKVLEFLYEENNGGQFSSARIQKRIKNIIKTATEFDPAHRYQSVSRLRQILQKILNKVDEKQLLQKIQIIAIVEAITAIILIGAVVFVPQQIHTKQGENENTPKTSIEETSKDEPEPGELSNETLPLLDSDLETVAQSITGKKNNRAADYDQITRIAVIGNQIYNMETGLDELEEMVHGHEFDNQLINGGIDDITLLSRMHNLKEVFLCDQNITDITPLKGLPIEKLYLSGNQIKDFSIIETLEQLQVLYIVNNPVSILPDVSKCSQLLTLNLCGNTYSNLDFLEKTNIARLYIMDIYVEDEDFTPLQKMPNLTYLYTAHNQKAFYEILPKLSQLTGLALWEYREKDLTILKALPNIEELLVAGDMVESMEGITFASNLHHLCIDGSAISDISEIEKLNRIYFFKINGNTIKDYTPLFKCSSLETLSADSNQQEAINTINPNHTFRLVDE